MPLKRLRELLQAMEELESKVYSVWGWTPSTATCPGMVPGDSKVAQLFVQGGYPGT